MAIEKPAPWTGASGTEYTFHVYGLAPDVPSRLGNFIYAKRNAEGAWVPVYMGHGDLATCCTDPGLLRCIAQKSATHLHLRLNSLEADRAAELHDLLAHYANAFAPEGCHPAPGAETATSGSRAASKPARQKNAAAKAAPAKAPAKKASTKKVAKKTATKKAAVKKPAAKTGAVKTPRAPRPRAK